MVPTFRCFSVALVVLLALSACTDSPNYTNIDDIQRSDRDRDRGGNGGDGQVNSDYSLSLLNEADELELYVGGSIDLRVLLADGGTPLENQSVSFTIQSGTGDQDTRLEALSIFVGADGVASNRLRVGQTTGEIVVRASHPWVETPLDITIDVTTTPIGDLQVSLTHPTQDIFELSNFEVRIWPTSVLDCLLVPPYTPATEDPWDEALLPTLSDSTVFSGLQALETYTVGVVGRGSHGQISARGCIQDVELIPEGMAQTAVELTLLPLAPSGTYDVISYWDFTEALESSGSVGAAIVNTLQWVSNPGGQIASFMLNNYIGPFFCDDWGLAWYQLYDDSTLCLGFRAYNASSNPSQTIENFINNQISSIGVLNEIMTIGQDLMEMVSNMKVESILTIDNKAVGEGEVEGRDQWQALYFYWTRGCDGTDPTCGEIRIGVGADSEIGVLQGRWDGRVYDYNQLEIDPHEVTIPYGRVITYLLNQHLLPGITGGNANNLGQAFEYLLCNNLGSFSIAGFTFDASTMQGFCSAVFNALGLVAELYVGSLTYSIDLDISGVGTLVDLESNGMVNIIEDGEFLGELYGEDGSVTEMEASFTAERQ